MALCMASVVSKALEIPEGRERRQHQSVCIFYMMSMFYFPAVSFLGIQNDS